MGKRAKLTLALLLLALTVGGVSVTFGWFLSVVHAPSFSIRSATVDWRPDGGWSQLDLITYGNLSSGSSTDHSGVAHILPSDSLLPQCTVKDGVRTIDTTLARLPVPGETAGTVLRKTTRFTPTGDALSETFREVKSPVELTESWQPAQPDPPPSARDYTIVTTSNTVVNTVTGGPDDPYLKIVTTVVTAITTYTPKVEGGISYTYTVTTSSPIIYDRPTYAGGTPAEFAATDPTGRLESVETIFYLNADVAHTHLTVLQYDTGLPDLGPDTENHKPALPLTLGNRSTTASQLRVSLLATLTQEDGSILPLEQQWSGSTCYLGRTYNGSFIDLFYLTPATSNGFQWSQAVADIPTNRAVWALTHGGDPAIPAAPYVMEPVLNEDGTPLTDENGDPVLQESNQVTEQFYPVFAEFTVAGAPHPGNPIDQATFELLFNDLYCLSSPTITVTLTYSARQNDYMAWSDFYSLSSSVVIDP